MLKIAIIGCGRIFSKHLKAINKSTKYFNLVGVFDKNKLKNKKAALASNTKIFNSLDELISKTNPDIISILVESGNHLKICKEIIRKYKIKNFVIEKPLDVSSQKIIKFQKFIKGKNVNIFTVKQNRFNKSIVKTKEIIEKNLIGSILMISASCKWKRDQSYYNKDFWRGKRKLDGGVLMNQAIHHIDLLIYLAGDVKKVIGFGSTKLVKIESENIAVASLKFKNGSLGTIEATTASRPNDYEGSITIMGSKGIIKIGGFASNKIVYFNNQRKTKLDLNKHSENISNVYGKGHIKFYKYVGLFFKKKITKNIFDIKSAIKSVKVVEKIVSSFKSEKTEII